MRTFCIFPVTFPLEVGLYDRRILNETHAHSRHVTSQTDTQVMQNVREGDTSKLALLFERHHIALYGYFVRLSGKRELSEDMVQEVFFRILKYRHTYRGDGEFVPWMYHIARNVHIDYGTRWSRENPLDEEKHDQPDGNPMTHQAME